MAPVRENKFLQSAKARRTSNKPNNMKAIKKNLHAFLSTRSNLLCSGMRHGDRPLHARAIQVSRFHVAVLGSDNIGLQK